MDKQEARAGMADYEAFRMLWVELNPEGRAEVERLQAQATGYAWGWQDRGGPRERETGDSLDFGRAYAAHAASYRLGKVGSRHSIQDAWQAWLIGKSIEQALTVH